MQFSSGHLVGSIVTPSPEHWLKAEDSVPGLFGGSMEGSDKGSDVGCLDGCFDGCLLSAEVISSSGHLFGSIVTPSPEHWRDAEYSAGDSAPRSAEGSAEDSAPVSAEDSAPGSVDGSALGSVGGSAPCSTEDCSFPGSAPYSAEDSRCNSSVLDGTGASPELTAARMSTTPPPCLAAVRVVVGVMARRW